MGAGSRRVAWSEGARRELDEAIAYIAEDSVDSAIGVLERILAVAESLNEMSGRGRIVPERGDPNIRELLVDPFRLLYQVGKTDITILGILHQRRNFAGWSNRGS